MIDGGGKAFRVLTLSLAILSVANARDSTRNSSTIEDGVKIVSKKSSNQEATTVDNGKMEARWEEDPPAIKSVKNVGWKSGRLGWAKDSYLEALKHSRTSTDPREGVIAADGAAVSGSTSFQRRKEYVQGPVYSAKDPESSTSPRIVHGAQDRDSFTMVPSDSYSLPTRTSGDFGAQNTYGPPQPPRGSYGPPSNGYPPYGDYSGGAYLPPQQAYGPPAPTYGAGVPYGHGAPHGITDVSQITLPTIDFSWPFALKLNAFTLAKILLKLVIFKMIVKFIAVICLLLFIPKLEIKKGNKGDMDDDEGRRLLDADSWISERLNLLTLVATNAAEKYRNSNQGRSSSGEECSRTECRVRRAFARDETWQDYRQLLRSYVLEESRPNPAKS